MRIYCTFSQLFHMALVSIIKNKAFTFLSLGVSLLLITSSCQSTKYKLLLTEGSITSNLIPPVLGQDYAITLVATLEPLIEAPFDSISQTQVDYYWYVDGHLIEKQVESGFHSQITLSSAKGEALYEIGEHNVKCYASVFFIETIQGHKRSFHTPKRLVGEMKIVTFAFDDIEIVEVDPIDLEENAEVDIEVGQPHE